MKLELYKPYKTRAGHKAVVVDGPDEGGFFTAANVNDGSLYKLWPDGHSVQNGISQCKGKPKPKPKPLDIVSEWHEPRKGEFWVNVYDNGNTGSARETKEDADFALAHGYDGQGPTARIACKKITWVEDDQE